MHFELAAPRELLGLAHARRCDALPTPFRPEPRPQGGEEQGREEAGPNGDLDAPGSYAQLEDYS